MTRLRIVIARICALANRRRVDRELDEELAIHIELAATDHRARGLSEAEARLAALRDLGGLMQTREAHRAARRLPVLDTIGRDVRYAVRSYRRTPVFTLVALLTLALTISANTAIFTLLNALVLRELPVRAPAGLVQVSTAGPDARFEGGLTFSMFRDLERDQRVFSAVIGWLSTGVFNITASGIETQGTVSMVTGNFFSELGVRPVAGRLLVPGDVNLTTLQPAMAAVLGYGFWQRAFGGAADVIGRRITVERATFTIVGIAPAGFTGFGLTTEAALTVPLTAYPTFSYNGSLNGLTKPTGSFWVHTTGRLQPGATLDQARAALDVMWPQLKAANVPTDFSDAQRQRFLATRLSVESAARGSEPGLRHQFTRPLIVVFGIALLVMALACVNLASLMAARSAARHHELGVRLALGAGRWRVAQQLLTEGVLLSFVGAAFGVGLAAVASGAFVRSLLQDYIVPATLPTTPDARVLTFTTLLAVVVGVTFSVVPAWRAACQPAAGALRANSRTVSAEGRTGRTLVIAQVALSLVLLTGAGLLVRSLEAIRAVPSGVQSAGVIVAYTMPRPGGYQAVDNDSYYPAALEALRGLEGVQSAAVSLFKPGGGGNGGGERVADANRPRDDDPGVPSIFAAVSPGFFTTLSVPLTSGRDFSWSDRAGGPGTTILSETLAHILFPAGGAIGRHVRIGAAPSRQSLEVIGIVADAHLYDLKDPNLATAYVAALQQAEMANWKCFVVRGIGVAPESLRRTIAAFGHERLLRTETLDHVVNGELLPQRLMAMLGAFFGAVAVLLAVVGVYGLMSYAVASRRREIGIRIALGASPRQTMTEILREGLTMTAIGIAIGAAGALLAVRVLAALLFGISPHDPGAMAAAPVILLIAGTLACLFPALRAAKVDPIDALAAE